MKIEFSADEIKEMILEKAHALCPTGDWAEVEIDMGYGHIRKATVATREPVTPPALEVVNG